MRNKISILLLSLFAVFMFTGCDDEQEFFEGPYQLRITGAANVVPESTVEYSLGNINNPESYNWTIESGPAEIVGAASGATVSVRFTTVGDVILSVTNGTDKGRKFITAGETAAAVVATTDTTATGQPKALSSGQSDTVFFKFAVPVEGMPSLALLTATDTTEFNEGKPFLSGTIGPLVKEDDKNFYAIYTAGEGNGTPEAMLRNIVSKEPYGSVEIDSAAVQLFRVDNIAPVASLTYSAEFIRSGSPVTITARFSEAVMYGDNPDNMVPLITLNGAGVSLIDTLEATDNPLVYTYEYTPETTGNGQVTVNLVNIVDFAGNQLSGVSNRTFFYIDNLAPSVTGTATDAGNYASIGVTSTNSGTVQYKVASAGTELPSTREAFMAVNGIASSTIEVVMNQSKSVVQALAKGEYVVFFMATDKAGNTSTITSAALTMD